MKQPATKKNNPKRQRRFAPVTGSEVTSSIYFMRHGTWYLDCFNVMPDEVLDVLRSTHNRERRFGGLEGIKAEPDKPAISKLNPPNDKLTP